MTLGTAEQVKLEAGTRVRVSAEGHKQHGQEGIVTDNLGPYPSAITALAEAIGVKVHEVSDALFVDLGPGTSGNDSFFADEVEVIADA